ncbi:MAG: hypothetical protein U5M23_11995 [Marinagarivorans sp.]|nr:hypothetical protein [Marinagarivorans sp.]
MHERAYVVPEDVQYLLRPLWRIALL